MAAREAPPYVGRPLYGPASGRQLDAEDRAVLGAVRIRLDFIPAVDDDSFASAFRFSSVSDAGAGFGGLGSVADATVGGELAAGIL